MTDERYVLIRWLGVFAAGTLEACQAAKRLMEGV